MRFQILKRNVAFEARDFEMFFEGDKNEDQLFLKVMGFIL